MYELSEGKTSPPSSPIRFAIRLLEQLPIHPIVTVPGIVKLLETTKPTAGKAVQLLESVGILVETSGRRRDRTFAYKAYLERLSSETDLEEG